jgi:hypothetical protein
VDLSIAMLNYQRVTVAAWWCNHHLETYESMGRMTSLIYEMENKICSKPPTRKKCHSHLIGLVCVKTVVKMRSLVFVI